MTHIYLPRFLGLGAGNTSTTDIYSDGQPFFELPIEKFGVADEF